MGGTWPLCSDLAFSTISDEVEAMRFSEKLCLPTDLLENVSVFLQRIGVHYSIVIMTF